jgi:Arylsulfotransferase (ASST)
VSGHRAAERYTRRQALCGTGVALAGLGLTAAGAEVMRRATRLAPLLAAPPAAFVSRPDLRIPGLTVAMTASGRSGSPILVAPYNAPRGAQAGPLIADQHGNVIWQQPIAQREAMDLRVQTYQGRTVLTWWEGYITQGHGVGHYVIADTSYRTLATPNAGNGLMGDLHEFRLTERGTALLTSYVITHADLRAVGGPRDGSIQDAIFQEIDVATGRVLLEWHSLDHIPITESYWPVGADWDYVHLNSVAVDADENLLVSSRNTHTVYKVDRTGGEIIWRLGGKRSDFTIAPEARFAWQHDAVRQPDGSLTIFDNGNRLSRALVLAIEERARTLRLRRAYVHPEKLFADSQGSVQVLPNGNVFVGWGAQPYASEFSPDGKIVFDARLGTGYISYRAFRTPWTGSGIGSPAVAIRRSRGQKRAYVSWNGDTQVTRWTLMTGSATGPPRPIVTVARSGFETAIPIPTSVTSVLVAGLDSRGRRLATSPVLGA